MKKRPTVSDASARSTAEPSTNTSGAAQRRRIAEYLLKHGEGTTMELREKCNALHPSGRIKEMRDDGGWDILTRWVWADDAQGRRHRVGQYVLMRAGGAA